MKRIAFLLLLMAGMSLQAQEGWKIEWHGFVNPHLYADSREVVGGREDMMLFYPKPVGLNAEGEDTNAVPGLNMLSITARLGLTVQGPDVLGAKMKGYIEGDFTGATNATINNLRLRHAYIDMRWVNDELLMGQYWYAMTIHEIMPGTTPLNMGAPFHPYARYNQFRYTHTWGLGNENQYLEAVAVAQFQLDNMSQGPLGSSTLYARQSMIPEMNLQLRYRGEHLFFGVAANMITLNYPTAGNFSRFSYSIFGKYAAGNWCLKAQTLLNNTIYEGCSMGGYVLNYNALGTAIESIESVPFNTVWADFAKTTGRWRPGIFLGYGQASSNPDPALPYYGRGKDIRNLWRVQPRLEYAAGNGLGFAAEVEYTQAEYLNGPADNVRLVLDAVYKF